MPRSYIAGIDSDECLRVVRHAMRDHKGLLEKYSKVLEMYISTNLRAMEETDQLQVDLWYWKFLSHRSLFYRRYAKLFHRGPDNFCNQVSY